MPAFHRSDLERRPNATVFVEERRQFADCHAVAHRDRELANE